MKTERVVGRRVFQENIINKS